MTPKMHIVWNVLERAKDADDTFIIAECRKCIVANRLGWEKYNGAESYRIVREFYAAD